MNLDELNQLLVHELFWRKTEIDRIQTVAELAPREEGERKIHSVLTKSLTLVLYSHWEGFIKKSALIYIEYVSNRRIPMEQLTENFRALGLKKCLEDLAASHEQTRKKQSQFFASMMKYFEESDQVLRAPFFVETFFNDPEKYKNNGVINTDGNLNLDAFESVLNALGMKTPSCYLEDLEPPFRPSLRNLRKKSLFIQIIDETLLKCRNHNAHGRDNRNHVVLDIDELKVIKTIVYHMIDKFKENIVEFVTEEYFLKENNVSRVTYESEAETELKGLISDTLREYRERLEANSIIAEGTHT